MNANYFESKVGNYTIGGQAHSLSAWFVLALRVMIGYAFLHTGLDKVLAGGFSAQGYLANVPAESPMAGVFAWMAGTDWMMAFVNVAVPWGEVLIGIAVLAGVLTRFAAFWGAFMMAMFYFGNWDMAHGFINSDFAYMLVFLAIGAFAAGRILGLDAVLEQTEFVKNNKWMHYLLG